MKGIKTIFIFLVLCVFVSCDFLYLSKENEHTVVFETNGGSYVEPIVIKNGELLYEPDPPQKDGYKFLGWNIKESGNFVFFPYAVEEDITLYAVWEPILFKLYLYINPDELYKILDVYYGETISLEEPQLDGYVFSGWYIDPECSIRWNENTIVDKNYNLYAKWTENKGESGEPEKKEFTVTFISGNGASSVDYQIIEEGNTVKIPNEPEKVGFTFSGWYIDEECTTQFDFDTIIESDIFLYAKWEEINPYADFKFRKSYFSDQGYAITKYTGPDKEIIELPSYYEGQPVTEITRSALSGLKSLKKVILPEQLKIIGEYAFSGCEALEDVILPSSVTEIGFRAFYNCKSLREIKLPDNLEEINYGAFSYSGLTYIFVPGKVKVLDDAFSNCKELKEVVLGEGISELAEYLFDECSSLEKITMPSTLTAINRSAFNSCTSLESITLPEGLETIGESAFYQSGIKEIEIPKSIKSIGSSAFAESYLSKISIPDEIEEIGMKAFSDCKFLETIDLEKCSKLEILDDYLFSNCSSLSSVSLPSNIKEISTSVFESTSLESVTIPSSVETIGLYAFGWCENLKDVKIEGNTLRAIYRGAFEGCHLNIEIPASVEFIEFLAITDFDNVTFAPGSRFSFEDGLLIETVDNQKRLKVFCSKENKVVLPDYIDIIGSNAFYNNTMDELVISESVKKIETQAIYFSEIKKIEIPLTVTTVEPIAIYNYNLSEPTEIIVHWKEGNRPEGWAENWYGGQKITVTYAEDY